PQQRAAEPAPERVGLHARGGRREREDVTRFVWLGWHAVSGPPARSVPVPGRAIALDRTASALFVQSALLGRARRARGNAWLRGAQAALDEGAQPFARVLAVALLGAEALRAQHQHALVGDAAITLGEQARAHGLGQARRIRDVEAQLDRGGHLVDVLPA